MIGWGQESAPRAVAALLILVVSTYVLATEPKTYYLWPASFLGLIAGTWLLLLAAVPMLRGTPGTPYRVLILGAQWLLILVVYAVVGRAVYSN